MDNLFNGLLMALVKMLVTDLAISHTIQNQLNPGQVTSFCFPYTRMYIYEYTSIYDYLYRLNVPKMCLWINIAHTPRWAAASVPIERPSGEHAKVDFNCNAIIMSHGLPSFPPLLPFSFSCPRRHFRFFFPALFSLLFVYHSHEQLIAASWSPG